MTRVLASFAAAFAAVLALASCDSTSSPTGGSMARTTVVTVEDPGTLTVSDLTDVWASPFGDGAYAIGPSALLKRTSESWSALDLPFTASGARVWATPPQLQVLASSNLYCYVRPEWTLLIDAREDPVRNIASVEGDLFAVTGSGVTRVRGMEVTRVLEVEGLRHIAGCRGGGAIALGNTDSWPPELIIVRYDGERWSVRRSLEQFEPRAVAAIGSDDYLVGGYHNTSGELVTKVWRVRGREWIDVTPGGLIGVSVMGGNPRVGGFVADFGRSLRRFDGSEWESVDPQLEGRILGISHTNGEAVYVCGEDGAIVRVTRD